MKPKAPVLCFAALAWAGGRPLDDDVTFLVLKFGGGGGRPSLET